MGGIYSNLEDLYRWDQALYTNQLLEQAALQEAFEPVRLNDGQFYPYGFGWHIRADGKTYYHMGGWLGFRTLLMRTPLDKNTIILLTNNLNASFEEITDMIYNILYNRPYTIPGL
ncbi:MAG: beta-lactamase family protein [Bacteroidia bacterium]|nr:beta-lactamase family protein [Bacteroidia bacterium]